MACISHLAMLDDANPGGNVHGGVILQLIELAGFIEATRFLNKNRNDGSKPLIAITARVESTTFLTPMLVGELAQVEAKVIFSSERSLLIEAHVFAENLLHGNRRKANTAFLWYVATPAGKINDSQGVVCVPQVSPSTEEEAKLFARGRQMYEERKSAKRDREESSSSSSSSSSLTAAPSSPLDIKRPISESQVTLSQLILPSDCSEHGECLGGVILKLMDNCAGIVSVKHCRSNVVTVSMSAIDFLATVRSGDVVNVSGKIVFTSARTVDVEVVVTSESFGSSTPCITTRGLLTFVPLDESKRPTFAPGVTLETDEEREKFAEGLNRYQARQKMRLAKSSE